MISDQQRLNLFSKSFIN